MENYAMAQKLVGKALMIFEKTLGIDHPYTKNTRTELEHIKSKIGENNDTNNL
jgi:hypothetical protein